MISHSPFRFAGAKTKLIPALLTYLDPMLINSDTFVDAFVGGGSVALAVAQKYPDKKIIINDLDDWMFAAWKTIVNDPTYLIEKLNIVPTIEMFNDISNTEPISELDKAFRAIFFNRCCFSGIVKRNGNKVKSSPIGGQKQKSKYKINCRYNYKKIKEKIEACHHLLKDRTQVWNLDINELLVWKLENSTLYLDPPYYLKASELYNTFMRHEDHVNLFEKIKNMNNWVLSYDDHEVIRELYSNQKIFDTSVKYSITSGNKKWKEKNELIILK